MSKRTPGPWRYLQSGIAGEFVVKSDTHPDLAIGIASGIDTEANARLIASAPELLEALEKLLISYQNLKEFANPKSDSEKQAEAAIAKARGEA